MTRRVLVAAITIFGLAALPSCGRGAGSSSSCTATAAEGTARLAPDQALNATTIAAVGNRLGLPDHAVTIALAAALQESKLRNLTGGDRDSVGLFQQRPSQGWGPRAQLLDPVFTSRAFFAGLAKVDGWESMAVTDAAQRVQHSAGPTAYAAWEPEARILARALTGEVATGLACRLARTGTAAGLETAIGAELGPPAAGVRVTASRGWLVSSWLVAHASRYPIGTVAFSGQRWSVGSGQWAADPTAGQSVTFAAAARS